MPTRDKHKGIRKNKKKILIAGDTCINHAAWELQFFIFYVQNNILAHNFS